MLTTITDKAIEALKIISNQVWDTFDDTHGYATEKKARVNSYMLHHDDDVYFFVGQFDLQRKVMFLSKLKEYVFKKSIEEKDDQIVKDMNIVLKKLIELERRGME